MYIMIRYRMRNTNSFQQPKRGVATCATIWQSLRRGASLRGGVPNSPLFRAQATHGKAALIAHQARVPGCRGRTHPLCVVDTTCTRRWRACGRIKAHDVPLVRFDVGASVRFVKGAFFYLAIGALF